MTFKFESEDLGRQVSGTWTIDPASYRDPDRYRREVHDCLSRTWVLATHSSLVSSGHHVVWSGFGQTVVVGRDGEGNLRAFHNVCQHRGARIVAESGASANGRFRCPWHGWVYDSGGALVGVPRRELFAAGACTDAPAVAVDEFAGFIWLHLTPPAPPLESYLAELTDELGSFGMESWVLAGTDEWVIPTNWKAVVDGFSEDYHASLTHRGTIPRGLDYENTRWSLFERHSMMATPLGRRDYSELAQPVDHRQTAYTHYTAFPTTVASCFPSHAQVMSIVPMSADETLLRVWVVGSCEPGDEARMEQLVDGLDHFRAIAGEDVGVLSELAPTRHSLAHRANVIGSAETRLMLFHRTLAEMLDERGPVEVP